MYGHANLAAWSFARAASVGKHLALENLSTMSRPSVPQRAASSTGALPAAGQDTFEMSQAPSAASPEGSY